MYMSRPMNTPKLVFIFATCSLLAFAGCKGGCGKSKAGDGGAAAQAGPGKPGDARGQPGAPKKPDVKAWWPLLQLVPEKPFALLFVGDPAAALTQAKGALTKLRGTTAGMTLEEIVRSTVHKMGMPGVDAFDPATWTSRGFDPAKGAMLVQVDEARGFLALGASDAVKVEPTVQAFLKRVDDVATFEKAPDGKATLALKADKTPVGAYLFHDGIVIIAGGAWKTTTEVTAFVSEIIKPGTPRFPVSALYQKLAPGVDLGRGAHIILPETIVSGLPPEARGVFANFKGLALRIEANQGELLADAFLPTTPESASVLKALAVPGVAKPGLARSLGDDTLLAGGGRFDVGALLKMFLRLMPPAQAAVETAMARLKAKMDIDIEKELFANLTGDSALGLHRLDAAVFPLAVSGAIRELLAADPLNLTLLLRVKDPTIAKKFLLKMAALVEAGNEKVGAVEVFPVPLLRMAEAGKGPTGGPVMRFALADDVLVLTLGKGRMEKALGALGVKDGPFAAKIVDPEAKRRLIDQPGPPLAYVVGSTLEANLRDLEGALLKKGNLMLSSIVQKAIELAEKFADLSLGGESVTGGLRAFLRVRFK